jgi:hypothetical protein
VTIAAVRMLVLAGGLGRGASGHHTGLYIAGSVVIALFFIGAATLRARRR